jgi:hypothetical protein
VTKDDIKRVMAKYIAPARRTVVEVRPTGMVDPPPKPAPAAAPVNKPISGLKTKPLEKDRVTKTTKASSLGKEKEGGLHKPKRK